MTATADTVIASGWRVARIGDLFDSWGGHTPSKSNSAYWGEGLPWVSSKDVKTPRLATSTYSVTQKAVKETGLRVCPPGSVLVVVRSGILAHTLPVSVTEQPVTINQDLKAFHSDEPLLNEWLALFLRMSAHKLLASSRRDGTTVQSVQYPLLKDTLMPVPPAEERYRIIEAIDHALAKQASVPRHLAVARRAIKRFRQAVLAAACSGRLTADWREANPDPPSVEHDLTELASDRRKRHYGDAEVDLSLPEVPPSYVQSTVGATAVLIEYGTSQRAASDGIGVPVLRMGNIQEGRLELSDLKYLPVDTEVERLFLQNGDLLFNRTNSPELVGKSAVFHEDEPMTFASYLIRVRFYASIAEPDFVNYWINSAWGRVWARHVKTDGVSQSNINGRKLAAMPLPLPPIAEQREIVRRASTMLRLADGLVSRIETASRRVERSSQAVFAKAFRGELSSTGGGALSVAEAADG